MKILRRLDRKIYAVHDTRPVVHLGISTIFVDVLVTKTIRGDDVLEDGPDGRVWLDGYEVTVVADSVAPDVS